MWSCLRYSEVGTGSVLEHCRRVGWTISWVGIRGGRAGGRAGGGGVKGGIDINTVDIALSQQNTLLLNNNNKNPLFSLFFWIIVSTLVISSPNFYIYSLPNKAIIISRILGGLLF